MKNEVTSYIENISLLFLGIFLLAFPFVFTTLTTEAFVFPKQIAVGVVMLGLLIAFGARMLSEQKVVIRRTPYDLPLVLFTVSVLASSLLSINRYDALFSFFPLLFAVITFFLIVNLVRNRAAVLFLVYAVVGGAVLLALYVALSYLKIYPLPYNFTHTPGFTPMGSIFDTALYLLAIIPIAIYISAPLFTAKSVKDVSPRTLLALTAAIAIAIGLCITIYQLLQPQQLVILPFGIGFQTAFAAISQDTTRTLQSFLFGSGFGTFITVFTRFKQATINQDSVLWSLTFVRSSSFALELLATTGVLGLAAFLFLVITVVKNSGVTKTKKLFSNSVILKNPFIYALLVAIVAALVIPFSFVIYSLFFILLGLAAAAQGLQSDTFFDIEFEFVTLKKGLISVMVVDEKDKKVFTPFLPMVFCFLFAVFGGLLAYYSFLYVASDALFQKSLIAASQNNGALTYQLQAQAISTFPYRDSYHRVFSQVNLQLATNLIASQPKDKKMNDQTQQTVYGLIQQSINEGRSAIAISPQSTQNWQNLSTIYRSLIGFGQSAENFALVAEQQAILLDPNNPNNYINLGGIYYQLGQWDNAQRQFQIAISLKPDFANAYYNLGHTLENKNDLPGALSAYETVKTLVANVPDSAKRITQEIAALQQKIGSAEQNKNSTLQKSPVGSTLQKQQPLEVNKPAANLPEQKPPVEIPGPPASVKATVTPTP